MSDISEAQIRSILPGGEHSIAWIVFHLARIEDISMNILVAGASQLFSCDDWAKKLNVNIMHSANQMDAAGVAKLSARIDIRELRAYRLGVGHRTREIVKRLKLEQIHQKPEAARLQRIMDEGALLSEAAGMLDYWSKRTVAGLLLMPPTRHNFLYLNEALRIKQKLQRGQ